ncbi:hypothetical protein CWI37_0362p0010 [Hamiltosporidium tvaerminnensis]|uniref:Uncharacterized protein n=1 Tax=Hamiltosporidium tvaerminnensis TaxID=1176355 RepID=A0A4V2JV92_9MICR|nr:hypothetical protein CWI37_0362p0010 [Hamiltosporidium tvaerminnensis]
MNNIGWEINKDMSAVTDLCCKDTVLFLKEKETTININEESDFEEEIEVFEILKRNI